MWLLIIAKWQTIITANPLWWHRVESKIKYILGIGNSLCLKHSGQASSIAI